VGSFLKRFKCSKCSRENACLTTDYEIFKKRAYFSKEKIENVLKKPIKKGNLNIFDFGK
jgi:hypothetical protein